MTEQRWLAGLALAGLLTLQGGAQSGFGSVRVTVTDPHGHAVHAQAKLVCTAGKYSQTLDTGQNGTAAFAPVPWGVCTLAVSAANFVPYASPVEVHSGVPVTWAVRLGLPPVQQKEHVMAPMVDPRNTSSALEEGRGTVEERASSLPGRTMQDLVVAEPGWFYEGNAVLHPRGAEYGVQFVVDGIPLTDNRSPGFGPTLEADDADGLRVMTGGYPAEFGRKVGGVVEVNTRRQADPGPHGELVLDGGSYSTAAADGRLQYVWGRNALTGNGAGATTTRYLNPVVPQNYTNTGTTGEWGLRWERSLGTADELALGVEHSFSRFLIPNELIQEQAGQIQNGGNGETAGTARYGWAAGPGSLLELSAMVRTREDALATNTHPEPIAAFQHNYFDEGYARANWSHESGRHVWNAGVEQDASVLHERFRYTLTDPAFFDAGTPASMQFGAARADLEQAAWAEDTVHGGQGWTVRAGLRADHYQLLLNQWALSPRLGVARVFARSGLVLHGSYDRVFGTPSSENILLSSSTAVAALSPEFLRLPVQPSRGNYYEVGATAAAREQVRLDANVYRRDVRNYADDDQLLNTGVSYPIAFDKGVAYGAEAKLTLLPAAGWSGYASFGYMVAQAWFPVTGGLFLGDDALAALGQLTGHFPASQDQRNTMRTRWGYQATRRLWLASGASYDSGLPFEYEGDQAGALATYGPAVVSRINFADGRVRPQLNLSGSAAVELVRGERAEVRLQVDGENLTDRLNVIDFGGLFSGNAIGPGRSVVARMNASF